MLNKQLLTTIRSKCANIKILQHKKINLTATKIILLSIFCVLFIYYGIIGAYLNSEIKKDINAKPKEVAGLAITGVANYIVKKEVQQNLWTPNLPFFFPTYFIDNLPNFQLGEIKAVSIIINALSSLAKSDEKLAKSAELLSYDGTIWMFEKGGVLPVPSAASQYKRGRALLKKSQPLDYELILDEASLSYFLNKISKSLLVSQKKIDKAIIEDENTDDIFYYNQGKIYVYYLFLKAITQDYKSIFIKTNLYAPMTSVIKALEDASTISPLIVKNADKSSSSANHLHNIGYYIQKAIIKLAEVQKGLKNEQ